MWQDTGIKLGIQCKNEDCGYRILGKCTFPQKAFCLNVSKDGLCENFVLKEKYQKDMSILFGELQSQILNDKILYDAFVASIRSALRDMPDGINEQEQAEHIANWIIGRGFK